MRCKIRNASRSAGRTRQVIDAEAIAALRNRTLGPEHKGLPPAAWGKTVSEFLSTAPTFEQLLTPALTLDNAAIESNVAAMAEWADNAGVLLAPHGKTTMAPQLWAKQLDAGAWGITLATVWQVQFARSYGVERIMLANALVDPVGLRWIAEELDRDPSFEFYCWADSVETVALMDDTLRSAEGKAHINVIVELGGPRGRTGARSVESALAVADAVAKSSRLSLAGVGGYEGALSHDRTAAGLASVRNYLDEVSRLHDEILSAGTYSERAIVTAGGSAYQDLVVERLAELSGDKGDGVVTSVVLRSGAYIIHDDGFYAGISPMIESRIQSPSQHTLRSAMHGWARVVSHPEPELALLDAGKRDLPYDEGLPVPQRIAGPDAMALDLAANISALNDQHAFLRLPGGGADAVAIGDVVRLGLSHPCTAFDKWRLIPVLDDADAEHPQIVDLIHTFF
jgi:D-serine deaminase-like pyridoxal phosphate-dependent protein